MEWEFFKYAEIGAIRAIVATISGSTENGTFGDHRQVAGDQEQPAADNSSVGEGVAFPWEANSFPYKRGGEQTNKGVAP